MLVCPASKRTCDRHAEDSRRRPDTNVGCREKADDVLRWTTLLAKRSELIKLALEALLASWGPPGGLLGPPGGRPGGLLAALEALPKLAFANASLEAPGGPTKEAPQKAPGGPARGPRRPPKRKQPLST